MRWNESYIVKDVVSMLTALRHAKREYTNSFQPELLKELVAVMLDCPERPEDATFWVHPPLHEFNNVCLTSGGADSTIAWYYSGKAQGIYIDVGQSYSLKERNMLNKLQIPYKDIDMRGTHVADNMWKHIIPGRNLLFLCVAAEMVKTGGIIWFGVVDGEGADSGKGDKSIRFLNLFMEWYHSCTGRIVNVETMLQRTKAGWLKWFAEKHDINIIRHNTVTCFNADEGQCGACQACLRKFLSFISIGIDISKDFRVHPLIGAAPYVKKYEDVLTAAQAKNDYSHYSRARVREDLNAIADAKNLILAER